jgi:Excalibur calcium-binding domain
MAARYNPPPNWPASPPGWTPPPDWEPDPAWGPPPYGWQLWVEVSPRHATFHRSHLIVALGFVLGVATLLGYVYFFSAPSDETSRLSSDAEPPSQPATGSRATPEPGPEPGEAGSRGDPTPYAVTPAHPEPSPSTPAGRPDGVAPPSTADPGGDAATGSRTPRGTSTAAAAGGDTGAEPSTEATHDTSPRTSRSSRSGRQPTPSTAAPPADLGAQERLTSGSGEPASDPRFGRCADANAAGYGPYRRGEPEYTWYVDTDRDGVACE